MARHRTVTTTGIYFITVACHDWLNLLHLTNSYDQVYNWFDVLQKKGNAINGYVIMPNHLHMLLYYAANGQSLNHLVGNGKRFMAYEIVNRLQQHNEHLALERLESAVNLKDFFLGKKHEIWRDSFDVKEYWTEKFIIQKLNYIHENPCQDRWKLVRKAHHYEHNSALFYLTGNHSAYPVKDYRDSKRIENIL